MKSTTVLSGLALALLALSTIPASAKSAHCYTTDDDYYDCNFKGLDGSGSFEISAPGHPTFTLWVDRPGVASGYADYGSGNVSLPGTYIRSNDDTACWNNSDTSAQICAW